MPNYREIFRQAAEERNSRELEAQAAKYRPQRISIKGEGIITDRSNPFIFWELKDVIYVFLFLREWEVTRWLFRKDKVIEPDEVGILHHMGDLTTELFETSYHNNSMDKLAKILSGQASYTNSSYNGFIRSKRFSKSSEYSNDYYRSSSWEGNSSRR